MNRTKTVSEVCKILKHSENELSKFVNGNIKSYNRRVEDPLPCNICHGYTYLDN